MRIWRARFSQEERANFAAVASLDVRVAAGMGEVVGWWCRAPLPPLRLAPRAARFGRLGVVRSTELAAISHHLAPPFAMAVSLLKGDITKLTVVCPPHLCLCLCLPDYTGRLLASCLPPTFAGASWRDDEGDAPAAGTACRAPAPASCHPPPAAFRCRRLLADPSRRG
jgi:hypothetical protein